MRSRRSAIPVHRLPEQINTLNQDKEKTPDESRHLDRRGYAGRAL